MTNFDEVLSRIQNQLEAMKKSLLHRREEHSEVVRQDDTPDTPEDQDGKNVPDPRPR